MVPKLEALMPRECLLREIGAASITSPRDLIPSAESYSLAYVRFLIFAISNNFAGLQDIDRCIIWDYIRRLPRHEIQRLVPQAPNPTIRALAEKLFLCAVEAGDHAGAQLLLERQPGIPIQSRLIGGYTVLEYACSQRNPKLVALLLQYGATVESETFASLAKMQRNTKVAPTCHDDLGALTEILGLLPSDHVTLRAGHAAALLEGILDKFKDGRVLEAALRVVLRRAKSSADLLGSDKTAPGKMAWDDEVEKRECQELRKVLLRSVEVLSHTSATRLFGPIIQAGLERARALPDHDPVVVWLKDALCAAIRTGNIDLVRIFEINDGKISTCLLHAAVYRGDEAYIRACIKSNPLLSMDYLLVESTLLAPTDHVDMFPANGKIFGNNTCVRYETCLSVALKAGNAPLISFLQMLGCMANIRESRRYFAALEAALVSGNLDFATQLTRLGVPSEIYNHCQPATVISRALEFGLEETALLMIQSRNSFMLNCHVDFSLLTLGIRYRQEKFVWAVMRNPDLFQIDPARNSWLCNKPHNTIGTPLTLAIQWQNLPLIRTFLQAGAHVLHNDMQAVMEVGNREIIRLLFDFAGGNIEDGILRQVSISAQNSWTPFQTR